MSTLSIALIAVYWVGAMLSVAGLGAVAWVGTRSVLLTGFATVGWLGVSVWLFGIYRMVVNIEAIL